MHTPRRGILQQFIDHGTPVKTAKSMAPVRLRAALRHSCHSWASRDATFVRSEPRAQTTMGNIVVLPWADVQDIPGLWLIPLGLIPQEGRQPRLIYDYT